MPDPQMPLTSGPTATADRLTGLLYRSRTDLTRSAFSASGAPEEFARNNRRLGLTGYLHLEDGLFFQRLEGPADEVEALWDRIRRDPRHHDVTEIERRPIARRSFALWSMGYDSSEAGQSLFDWAARSGLSLKGPGYGQVVTGFLEYASGSRLGHAV